MSQSLILVVQAGETFASATLLKHCEFYIVYSGQLHVSEATYKILSQSTTLSLIFKLIHVICFGK